MNIFAKRYIQLKESHPELAQKMPNEIQNVISNVLYTYMKEHEDIYGKLDIALWTDFLDERLNEYEVKPHYGYYSLEAIEGGNCIFKFAMIDFFLNEIDHLRKVEGKDIPSFAEELNNGFKRVNYKYRIIGTHIIPINDFDDYKDTEKALQSVPNNIKQHLNKAMLYLFITPDYENSVKESISAIEAFCYIYTKKNVLTDALKVFDKKDVIHPQLKKAFENIYYYSSEKGTGIRHGKAQEDTKYSPDFYEAKFMLSACSAFINYIEGKCSNALQF